MPDIREVYEMVTKLKPPEPGALERQRKRQVRRTINRKLGGFAAAAAIVGLAFLVVRASMGVGGQQPTTPNGTGPSVAPPGVPRADYVIDLNTGVMTPLPEAIVRSTGGEWWHGGPYAASPDGSLLAYGGGTGEEIFIAGIDGTGIRQVALGSNGVGSLAWSPDGTRIAHEGWYGSGRAPSLFVLDVASGRSTQIDISDATSQRITDPTRDLPLWGGAQFTPDGFSLLYTGSSDGQSVLRTVPVTGGTSTLLIGPDGDLIDAVNGSLSPDGSLVTFLGSVIGGPGPQRWVANVDGTERRLLPDVYGIACVSNPSGTWSPDGSRIVCSEASRIIVIDIATGDASPVAWGRGAIWLGDHTLLVEI